jgi:hypothetical protein
LILQSLFEIAESVPANLLNSPIYRDINPADTLLSAGIGALLTLMLT